MKEAKLPISEIAIIGATRGMIGTGLGLLIAGRMMPDRRKAVGWPLLIVGALSTIPLAIDVARRTAVQDASGEPQSDRS